MIRLKRFCFVLGMLLTFVVFAQAGEEHPTPLSNPPPSEEPPPCENHIEIVNGALVHVLRDLYVPGLEPEFRLIRTYRSQQLSDGFFGKGWHTIFNSRISVFTTKRYVPRFVSLPSSLLSPSVAKLQIENEKKNQIQLVYNFNNSRQQENGIESIRSDYPLLLVEDSKESAISTEPLMLADQGAPAGAVDNGPIEIIEVYYTIYLPDGTIRTFKASTNIFYSPVSPTSSPGTLGRLIASDTDYSFVEAGSRLEYHFSKSTKYLTSITTPEGNALIINRDEKGNPTSVVDAAGRTYTITTSNGKITSITDHTGRVFSYEYNISGLLSRVSAPENQITEYSYNSAARLSQINFPNGGIRHYIYSGKRVIRRIDEVGGVQEFQYDTSTPSDGTPRTNIHTDARGNKWFQTFDADGNLLFEVDPYGETTTYTYDGNRRMTSKTMPDGAIYRWEYNQNGFKTTEILPDSRIKYFVFDARGIILAETNALSEVMQYSYDTYYRLTKIRHPDGSEENSEYNLLGLRTSYSLPGKPATTTTYDQYGLLDLVTDPNGKTWDYDYDNRGNLVKIIDPLGRVIQMSYDERGRLVSRTNPDGSTEAWSYSCCGLVSYTDGAGKTWSMTRDYLNRVTSQTDPTGRTITLSYDPNGNIISSRLQSGATTQFEYDSRNQLVAMKLPQVGAVESIFRYDRDSMGRIVRMVDPTGRTTTMSYDSTSRLVDRKYPDGSTETFAYNAADRLIASRDGLGRIVTREYTSRGFLSQIEDDRGARVALEYDSAGLLTKLVDPRENATAWEYTATGDVAAEVDPLSHRIEYSYDNARQLLQRKDGRGIITTYEYDAMGRLIRRNYPTRSETYAYDSAGRVVMKQWGSDTNYERVVYDEVGRVLTHYQTWLNDTVENTYDEDGRRSSRFGPFNEAMSYDRDAQGRLTQLLSFADNFEWSYDATGRPVTLTRPNGTHTDYEYDAFGRIARIHHIGPNQNNLLDILYSYDSGGQIVGQSENDTEITYGYDNAGQLTSATYSNLNLSWTYDLAGNRLTEIRNGNQTNYEYDAVNELIRASGKENKYDSSGNMINRSDGRETFAWDEENRLIRYESGTLVVMLQYADDWRVITRTVNGTTELFAYDGADFAGKRNPATGDTVLWVYSGERIDEVLAELNAFGTNFPLADHLGSVRGQTDPLGALASRADYEPWGNLRNLSGPSPSPSYLGFTSRPELAGRMLWLRWRHLDPTSGAFVSRDPIGFLGGLNVYRYVTNKPTYALAPFGLAQIQVVTTNNILSPHTQIQIWSDAGQLIGAWGFYPYGQTNTGWNTAVTVATTLIGTGQGIVQNEQIASNVISNGSVVQSYQFDDCQANSLNQVFSNMAYQPTSYFGYNWMLGNCGMWAATAFTSAVQWLNGNPNPDPFWFP